MADTEEYFPRGGKKPTTTHFKQSANFLGAPEKRDKKKKKIKKKSEGDDGYLSDEGTKEINESFKNCAYGLSYKTIKEGVLILGRVKNVLDTKVIISLPCRMIGNVMACHISEPYNKQLEDYVNDKVDRVIELGAMFRAGQFVAVKVLEVKELNIMLSMMPQHVNGQKKQAELHKGTLLQAAVSSIEDHGYVMDIGVPDVRAFLPKKNANPEVELAVGALSWCAIKSVSDGGVVTLSNELATLQNCYQRQKTTSPIPPGSSLEFSVETPLANGIEGVVFGDTAAYIQRQHADTVKGKKPALGQKIRARLLYVMPTRNTPFLTMKSIFETTYPDLNEEQKLRDGDIVENAKVLKITGRSIHFRLGGECYGTMSLKRIQVDEELTDEEVVAKSYPIGSVHKVRVLCYNLSDYVYSVTDQPDVVGERYFSLAQLTPGEVVHATVKTVADGHVILNVGRVTGYVSQAHLYDTGIYIDPKKSSTSKLSKKKYKVGQSVTARVLSLDVDKQTLFLTLKPSLLAPELDVLDTYERALVGKAYTGVIKTVREFVVVSFFNNVTAYVSRQYVSKEPLDHLADNFHVGQIVNCTILRVDPASKKMSGSLTTTPFWPQKKREPAEKRKQKPTDEVPSKKVKKDEQLNTKDKEIKQVQDSDEEETVKSKKKKTKKEETQTDLEQEERTKKKKKGTKTESENENVKKKNSESEDTEELNTNKIEKKSKKRKLEQEPEEEDTQKNVKEDTEESDAIETDIYDSDQVLSPQELGLIDLSDCTTAKDYKKRIASLLKTIKNRTRRIDKIDKKLTRLEENGLNAENKKFHTAMNGEKLVLKDRIEKLLEAMCSAQEKLKEFGEDDKEDYKKKSKEEKEKQKELIKEQRKLEKEKLKEQKKEAKAKKKEELGNTEVEKKSVSKKVDIKVVESLEPALDADVKDFWSLDDSAQKNVVEEDSSSSEDEEQDQPKKKRKKLSVAEKLSKLREEEERVREMERRAIESESAPRSSDQFERALLANPNCSQLWIAYMAFHLQATEVEKARSVARKALNTISFREECDKLNVCLAIINFEHRFGTKESQQKALEEALQINEPFKVHSKLLDIYVETSKHQELVALVDLMMRKYKRDPSTYIMCGSACFKLGLVDKARQVMQKAIAVLEKKEHVTVLVQFALLERSHGARERAEALFEQVLAVYPQRVDVCSTYVDMLIKGGDVDHVRQVMERMTSQKLPARKMKILYKKWIEVEEKIGDQEQCDKIKQQALAYIEKAKF
ncbi:ribosomal RNA Processing 5 [Anticarsia gemmatalis]|uniref:ribosomal RNA Processing 5 n=1 Tax=Anticarsia gemmatalis TaxID=129554 RepID=UPI003F75A914